jgi:hypothetical protein
MQRHATHLLRVVVAGLLACTGSACVNFDLEEQFTDTRILGARTSPAEIMFSPLFLLPANQRPPLPIPNVDVEVELFAFDSRGGEVTVSTQMCPDDASDASCRLYDKAFDENFARLVDPAKSEVEALLTPVVSEPTAIADDVDPVGRVTPSTFQYTITSGAIDFFQPKNAAGENVPSIFSLLPRVAFQVENITERDAGADIFKERAFKRLPLSIDLADPSLPDSFKNTLANSLGIRLCGATLPTVDEVSDEDFAGGADCLYSRGANVNPAAIGFRLESTTDPALLSEGMLEGVPDLGVGSLVRASPGGTIALTPMWEAGAVERYQVLSFDIASSKLTIENRVEDMACTWYSSRGFLNGGQTSLEFTDNRLGAVWTLPTDAKAGERDSIVMVANDQRGGTSVVEVTVEYR